MQSIHWPNLITLVSATLLVGVELIAAGWAAGWALGGLMQLGDIITYALEAIFVLAGIAALVYFVRAAAKIEVLRGQVR